VNAIKSKERGGVLVISRGIGDVGCVSASIVLHL
jgi:hypothetical protein